MLLPPLFLCLLGTLPMGFGVSSAKRSTTSVATILKSPTKVLREKINQMSVDVSGLKKSVDILKTEADNNKNAVDVVRKMKVVGNGVIQEGVAKLESEMTDHKKYVTEMQKKLHSEMQTAANLQKDLTEIKNEITTINEDIANIKTCVISIQKEVALVKTHITDVTTLQKEMAAVKAHITDVTTLQKEMAAVKANVADLTNNVTLVVENVGAVRTQDRSPVCPALPHVDNAHVAHYGEIAEYTCKSSFILCGTAKVECFTGRQWEEAQVSCEQSQWNNVGGPVSVPVPKCFKTGMINIVGRPSTKRGFEVALSRENGDSIFYHHIRIEHFLGHRMNCFNTVMGGTWEQQVSNNQFFPWLTDVSFHYLLEVTQSSFEVTVDGQHMISFPNRYPSFVFTTLEVRLDVIVDNIVFTKN